MRKTDCTPLSKRPEADEHGFHAPAQVRLLVTWATGSFWFTRKWILGNGVRYYVAWGKTGHGE